MSHIDLLRYALSTVALAVLAYYGGYLFLTDKHALRDSSNLPENKPYSLARVQLWWWTIVIIGTYIVTYLITWNIWQLNGTCLLLLGISLGTTATGRVIDIRHIEDPMLGRNQDKYQSEHFFADILSDENGLSVHRFQTVIFNLVYGGSFFIQSLEKIATKDPGFPDFGEATLALLGISSASYLALKTTEAKPNGQSAVDSTTTAPVPAQKASGA